MNHPEGEGRWERKSSKGECQASYVRSQERPRASLQAKGIRNLRRRLGRITGEVGIQGRRVASCKPRDGCFKDYLMLLDVKQELNMS